MKFKKGFNVCEIFETLQGEGRYSGRPALFIRLHGCNLKCPFCDEPKHRGGLYRKFDSVDALAVYILAFHKGFLMRTGGLIVISGGEPTLYNELPQLIQRLRAEFGALVCVESNGYNPKNAVGCDLYTFSPKDFVDEAYDPWNNIEKIFCKKVNLDVKLLFDTDPTSVERIRRNMLRCRDLVYTNKQYRHSVEVFLSPINLRNTIFDENVKAAIEYILNQHNALGGLPLRLNSQIHKIFKFQ